MSSLIEQATQRLEQLRRAGADVPALASREAEQWSEREYAEDISVPERSAEKSSAFSATANATALSTTVELDLDALALSGIISPNAPRSHIADQYRVIKRPLIGNATGRGAAMISNGNLIMITSAVSGEGKSFTAINLAMSIATELDHTVLLVDADVARPSVLRMLGLSPCPGLLDVLVNDTIELGSVLLRTNIDKLTILPSGTAHPRATELLASDSMTRLLLEMASRYHDRIIIFDSPPLLLTTEARVLASHMGQIVVVVQANKTLQSDVQLALSTIETCPVKMVMLNQATVSAGNEYGYGYGYGGGYGYGYGNGYGNGVNSASGKQGV